MRIEQRQDKGQIIVDQDEYINKILKKFNMSDCNSSSTLMDLNVKLSKIESMKEKTDMDRILYQKAIGSLLYAAQISRPDINYAVYTCNRYNNNPGQSHWSAVKRIFRYLQEIRGAKLIFQRIMKSMNIAILIEEMTQMISYWLCLPGVWNHRIPKDNSHNSFDK